MSSTISSKSNLNREELIAFLESYRNVIEFNTHVLEEVKNISLGVKSLDVELREFHHKLDVISKDIFFKFGEILTLLKTIESNYSEHKDSVEDLKKVKQLTEEISELIKTFKETNKDEHSGILFNVKVGWISLSTFFVTVLGGILGFLIAYYQQVELLRKIIEHFGIK